MSWVHKVIAQNIHSTFLGSSSSSSQNNEEKVQDKPAFIIIHGAGSFGHYHAKQYGLRGESDPPSVKTLSSSSHTKNHYMSGLAHTRNSVKTLNNIVVSSLLSPPSFPRRSNNNEQNDNQKDLTSINAVGISPCINIPSLQAYGGDSHSVSLLIQSIKEALQVGLVPVIHGDAGLYGFLNNFQSDDDDDNDYSTNKAPKIRSGILGGDTLVEIIATSPLWDKNCNDKEEEEPSKDSETKKTQQIQQYIDEVLFLTDVNGVFTKDPNKYPNDAKLLKKIIIDPLSGEIDSVVQVKDSHSSVDEDEAAEVKSLEIQGSSHEHDVTGGLKAKLSSAMKVAKTGIQVKIVKCCSKTAEDVLEGCETDLGTTISRKK